MSALQTSLLAAFCLLRTIFSGPASLTCEFDRLSGGYQLCATHPSWRHAYVGALALRDARSLSFLTKPRASNWTSVAADVERIDDAGEPRRWLHANESCRRRR